MKLFVRAVVWIALLTGHAAAAPEGRLEIIDVPSPSLAAAELAPSQAQRAAVYLPPSYGHTQRRYPVVYFLPGYNNDTAEFLRRTDVKSAMDRQIAQGKVQEMIVVITSGYTPLGGGFYVNSAVHGNWEDYITADLLSHIDGQYRTLAKRDSRGIAGQSMGGFGALNLAMRHPKLYRAVYAMSPGLAAPDGMKSHPAFGEEARAAVVTIQEKIAGLDRKTALAEMVEQAKALDRKASAARFALAYGTVFAALPDSRLLEYPYPADDARIWARYDSGFGNLAGKLSAYKAGLKQYRAVIIDVGDHDHYQFIREGCRAFSALLTRAGLKHRYDVYDGDHSDKVAERLEGFVLPSMSDALKAQP